MTHKEVAGPDEGKGTGGTEGKGLGAHKQDRDESTTDMCTQVRKKTLGEVVDLQNSSPPTSRTAKFVDLNSLEKCIYGNMGQGNPKHGYRQGNEWIEGSPVGKDLGVLCNHCVRPIKVSLQPRKPTLFSCTKRSGISRSG